MKAPSLGHADMMAIAMKNHLLADQSLAEWTNGRIFRSHLPGPLPNISPPMLVVSAVSDESVFGTSNTDDVQTPLAVYINASESQRQLSDNEASVSGWVDHLKKHIRSNYYLKDPTFGNRRLVYRHKGFRVVNYSEVTENSALFEIVLICDFRVELDLHTRKVC